MIFGSKRDANLLTRIDRELVQRVVEQEILFYKVDVVSSEDDIYGEAPRKAWFEPVRINCLVKRADQSWSEQDYGTDYDRPFEFRFIKADFEELGFRPDLGDIIEWHKIYYEVDGFKENQLFVGKDDQYRLHDGTNETVDRTNKFGKSISVVLKAHPTRYTKLNIIARD